jgi:hypothetical protein
MWMYIREHVCHLRSLACGLRRTLHLPPALLESSHVVLDPNRGLRRLRITRLLLRCALRRIFGLRTL